LSYGLGFLIVMLVISIIDVGVFLFVRSIYNVYNIELIIMCVIVLFLQIVVDIPSPISGLFCLSPYMIFKIVRNDIS